MSLRVRVIWLLEVPIQAYAHLLALLSRCGNKIWVCRTLSRLLSPGEIAQIRAEVKRLEEALKECRDEGIRKRIIAWIEEQKKKLAES
jgi:hypothetical protein